MTCNSIGELWVKGYNVMIGYYGNEKATADSIVNGWMKTGDLATIDEEVRLLVPSLISD